MAPPQTKATRLRNVVGPYRRVCDLNGVKLLPPKRNRAASLVFFDLWRFVAGKACSEGGSASGVGSAFPPVKEIACEQQEKIIVV